MHGSSLKVIDDADDGTKNHMSPPSLILAKNFTAFMQLAKSVLYFMLIEKILNLNTSERNVGIARKTCSFQPFVQVFSTSWNTSSNSKVIYGVVNMGAPFFHVGGTGRL